MRRETAALVAFFLCATPARAQEGAEWRQTFMAPRVTGNLRAVAVDPDDPKNLYVGTEEGTLAHSTDGGITWDEIALSPFLLQSPTTPLGPGGYVPFIPNPPEIDVFAGFFTGFPPFLVSANPLNRLGAGVGIPTAAPSAPPANFLTVVRFEPTQEPLLGATAAKDPQGYQELVRIRVCPGAAYAVLVAAKNRLYGTPDGTSFLPLLSARDSQPIADVVCSRTDSSEIIVATGDGTLRSTDGGSSFDLMSGAFGPAPSAALAFGLDANGKEQLVAATGADLWIGDPSVPEGMHVVAPPPAVSPISSIAVTPKSMWLATSTGVRVSRDSGKSWDLIDDLEGFGWQMIAVIPDAGGREQVAVMREDAVFASVDGASFEPFFRGQSRRRLRQIVASSDGFLLLTSGEVWTTVALPSAATGDDETRRWAQQRLRRMPSLSGTLSRALAHERLTDANVDEIESALRARAWLPGVTLALSYNKTNQSGLQSTYITGPQNQQILQVRGEYVATANFVWELPDFTVPSYNVSALKRNLYELRKRFSYVIEDAYNERQQLLSVIAGGGLNAEQLLTLEGRIEVLDTVLQQFTGEAR